MSARRPANEATRLEQLRRYQILDTPPEQVFDDLLSLAAHVCKAPLAAITFVDQNRVWLKSQLGLTSSETSRDAAFCARAILDPGVFVVADAQADPAFADNPMVTGEPHVRFYAGAPLVASGGHAVGVLCVLDRVPRLLGPEQGAALRLLARLVVQQLEVRRSFGEQLRAVVERQPAPEFLEELSQSLAVLRANLEWVGQHLTNALMGAALRERLATMAAGVDENLATVRHLAASGGE